MFEVRTFIHQHCLIILLSVLPPGVSGALEDHLLGPLLSASPHVRGGGLHQGVPLLAGAEGEEGPYIGHREVC